MEQSEQSSSHIGEQQHLSICHLHLQMPEIHTPHFKYATVNDIRSFERESEIHNQSLVSTRPLLFHEDDFTAHPPLHFVSEDQSQYFTTDGKQEPAPGVLESKNDRLILKIPISNIKRQNTFIMQLKNLKKKYTFQLQNIQTKKGTHLVRFKYIITLNEINVLIKVLVELNGEYKIWKEMQVPLTENRCRLEIQEFHNQQTDIKINDFLFHLLLKMPYQQQSYYCFIHHGKAEVEKIQFISQSQKKRVQPNETSCSKQCQLI